MILKPNVVGGSPDELEFKHPLLIGMEFFPAKLQEKIQSNFSLLSRISQKNNWDFNLSFIREFIRDEAHTIVLTDAKVKILWVNDGFQDMTGYTPEEAIGQSPKFLQGRDTDPITRKEIREKIESRNIFKGKVLNYRKNGEPYLCQVSIEPIFNDKNELVNFIAFEREIAA
jgi:PAS domain S-box-containing protein